MTAKNIVSRVTLGLAVAAVVLPMSGAALAGGYGYGSQSGWSGGYQAHTPKRQKVRKHAYAGGNRHLAWCYNRYRSYRLMDNSFQPYHGPRQECLSPYEQERRALFVGYPGEAPEILFRDQAGPGQDRTMQDAFGNLPEQAAVSGTVAPAVESQPVAESAEGSEIEEAPATVSETDRPSAAATADGAAALSEGSTTEAQARAAGEEAQPAAVLEEPASAGDVDGETVTD